MMLHGVQPGFRMEKDKLCIYIICPSLLLHRKMLWDLTRKTISGQQRTDIFDRSGLIE